MKSLIKTIFCRVAYVLVFVFTQIPLLVISLILIILLGILSGFVWFIGKEDCVFNMVDHVIDWPFDYSEFLEKLIE